MKLKGTKNEMKLERAREIAALVPIVALSTFVLME